MATPPNPAEIDTLLQELVQRPENQAKILILAVVLLLIDKGIVTNQEFEVAKEAAERAVIQQLKDNTSESDMETMLFLRKLLGGEGSRARPPEQGDADV